MAYDQLETARNPPETVSKQSLIAFGAITAAACLNPINGSLIVTAYPTLAEAFHVPYAQVSALVMYFLATTAAAQPLAGALGDYLGSKKTYVIGIVGFSLSSLAAGHSGAFESLIFWRAVQAVFSGVITANAATLVYRIIPASKIGVYLGFLSAAVVGATALAFPFGGVLIRYFEWPVLFWCSLPFAFLSLVCVLPTVPKDQQTKTTFTALSFIGLPVIPIAVALQALIQGTPALASAFVAALAIALVAVVIIRSSHAASVFSAISSRQFNVSGGIAFFAAGVTYALMFMLPVWIPAALHITAIELGLYLSIFTLAMTISSPIAGRVADARGYQVLRAAVSACSIAAFAFILFALSLATFLMAITLVGVAIAIAQVVSQRASLLAAPIASRALAMGLFNSYRSLGCIAGNALPAFLLAAGGGASAAAQAPTAMTLIASLFVAPMLASFFALRDEIAATT